MGLFKFFSGKTPAEWERTGDALVRNKSWGEAKLAFESALDKLAKQSQVDPVMNDRILAKLNHSKEALAKMQYREAMALMEAGVAEEAIELFGLAIELTADPQLKEALAQQTQKAVLQQRSGIQQSIAFIRDLPEEPEEDAIEENGDDYFNILLGALPNEVQHVYRRYGPNFKQGYLALNQGAFDQAVEYLIEAMEDNPSPQSLVPLELATAYANMGQAASARSLLEELVQHHPDLLPAFQLLCEIYWEDKDFDQAMLLLDTLAPELAQSAGAFQLRGETLMQATRYEEAKSFFQDILKTYGWNESIALGLANAFEALGQLTRARDIYGELISQCSGCGTRIDPSIKRKYADLSLASGHDTTKALEYYLSLIQEDPSNVEQYCKNISRIYLQIGNETESMRFQSIAEDLARKRNQRHDNGD